MDKETTANRLRYIMRTQKLKQVDILTKAAPFCERYKIKLNKSDLSQFISGKVEPGQWKLTILGLALGVSEAWLMGYNVSMERENSTAVSSDGIKMLLSDPLDIEFFKKFTCLTTDQKDMVLAQIEGILSRRSEK